MAKLGLLARKDSCAGMRGMLDKLMTHLFLLLAAVCSGIIVDVVAGAVGVVDAVVVVVALLETLLSCTFTLLWGCLPKRACLPKVPKL